MEKDKSIDKNEFSDVCSVSIKNIKTGEIIQVREVKNINVKLKSNIDLYGGLTTLNRGIGYIGTLDLIEMPSLDTLFDLKAYNKYCKHVKREMNRKILSKKLKRLGRLK